MTNAKPRQKMKSKGPWVVWASSPATLNIPHGVDGTSPIAELAEEKTTFPAALGHLKTSRIFLQKGPNILCASASSWAYRDVPLGETRFPKNRDQDVVGVRHTVGGVQTLVDEHGAPRVSEQEAALLRLVQWAAKPGHAWSYSDLFKSRPGRALPTLVLCQLDESFEKLDSGQRAKSFAFARDRQACGVVHDRAVLRHDWSTVEAARVRARAWFGGPA